MKTVLFARVSSREQEETGYSLPSQEKLLSEYAVKKDFRITKKFSISESASGRHQRKAFDEMLEYVRKNDIKVIICEKVDRLTRNMKDAGIIDDWVKGNKEREVHFVKENFILNQNTKAHENFVWDMKVAIARYYTNNLSEEVKKGQKEKIAQGWIPCRAKLGYKTIGDKGHKTHILDENKAPLIKKMFELYASGNHSLKRLVEKMFEEGLKTNEGNKLVKSRMADILSDPFYMGKIRWNGEIYNGMQETLVSEEMFALVQKILTGKTTPRYTKHDYLFRGFLKCMECGGLITWEKHKGITYGHCNHYRNCSQSVWAKERETEEQILPYFNNLVINNERLANIIKDALKESHKDEIEYHNKSLEGLNSRYEQIQKRLNIIYDDKLDGKITTEFYEQKFKQYTEEKESIISSISRHSNSQDKYFELGVNILELSQKAPELYQKASIEDKRTLLNLVFSNLTLNQGKLEVSYAQPFNLLAESVNYTNNIFEPQFCTQKAPKGAKIESLLAKWDAFRTSNWINYMNYPERMQKILLSCLQSV